MKRRRLLVAGTLVAIAPACAFAQERVAKVGFLNPNPLAASTYAPVVVRRLAELGYRQGAGMQLEYRSTDGAAERLPKLALELIDLKCEVIFTIGHEQTARTFRHLRSQVPVVFLAFNYDPLESGIVDNLRRPGANITGVWVPERALAAKRLEIAQEVLPAARRFLVMADVYSNDQLAALRRAAEARGAHLTVVEFAKPPYDYESAFQKGRQAGTEALVSLSSPLFARNRAAISALLATYRLPAVGPRGQYADAGYLLSYGADAHKAARRAAEIGARILKGAKAADIPVEQADEFELVVNLKTAKALGVKIPYSVLARATRVIE